MNTFKLKPLYRAVAASTLVTASLGIAASLYSTQVQAQTLGEELDSITDTLTNPWSITNLPPGQLGLDILALTLSAQERAFATLNAINMPANDATFVGVESDGSLFYADQAPPTTTDNFPTPAGAELSEADTMQLHSKPGAPNVLFLDFDGHTVTGTQWNATTVDPLFAQPFDTDGNPSSFSNAELNIIAEIWHRVAEDYAGFDVDITTEEPTSFGPTVGRILITPNVDANGVPMPASNAGGVAYVNVFGRSDYADRYSPAFVYSNNLGNLAPYIAEASSHEGGHNLGLSHDGTATNSYYDGHGSGWTSWGPIMGSSYYDNVTQWSSGEYDGANNGQDDIAVIASKLGLNADDHGNTPASASLLTVAEDGSVNSTTPETDLYNVQSENKGVIGHGDDVDVFGFSAAAGDVTLSVTPSWAAFPEANRGRGTNLDVSISLLDASGGVVSSADALDNTDATISASVSAGDYFLVVSGTGNANSPYSAYGSQGLYFINGSVPVQVADLTPPSPNPMSWEVAPTATGTNSMTMTAITAADDSGSAVQYNFQCVSGGAGCNDSGWQSSTQYNATGLAAGTSYAWTVSARDVAGNETNPSDQATATTDSDQEPVVIVAPSNVVVLDNKDGTATISWSDVTGETAYIVTRESFHPKRQRWQSTSDVATVGADTTSVVDVSGADVYRYQVTAVYPTGTATSAWIEITVTEGGGGGDGGGDPDGGGGGGSCKGGPKKCG